MVFPEKHQSKYCIFQTDKPTDVDRYTGHYLRLYFTDGARVQLVSKHSTAGVLRFLYMTYIFVFNLKPRPIGTRTCLILILVHETLLITFYWK